MRRTLESIIHQPPPTAAAVRIKFLAVKYHVEAIIQQPEMCRDMGSTVISVIMQRPNFYRKYATPIFDSIFLLSFS